MSKGASNSIINFGDISKPADTLIKKVASAVGCIYEPYQIKRIAKAEAEASLIRATGDIQVKELQRRAIQRLVDEEARKQTNIEQITAKALPLLEHNSKPEEIEDDWITDFFDKCRLVSDEEMQSLWSKVLSGEANKPGSYSKRTVNFISCLDKSEAMLFSNLCGFICNMDGQFIPIIYDVKNEIYKKNGIYFMALNNLESIGLIKYDNLAGFQLMKLPKTFSVLYYGQSIIFEMPNDDDNSIDVGSVLLTKLGKELAPICGSQPVNGFKEYILEYWKSKNYIKKENTEPINTADRKTSG